MADAVKMKFAAEAAKEITIAKMATESTLSSKDRGKYVADFYSEVFNGIFETLKKADKAE